MKKARRNSKQAYRELVKVLNYREQESREPSPVFIVSSAPESRFQEGHIYRIRAAEMTRKDKWESECVFRYERQSGIHYVFREQRGGWTRTYTDAQLVGKIIKEV